jgi:branched-chain amino acid transport system substrate-binding protein
MDPAPDEFTSELLFEMLASLPDPPQTIALVTTESGSTQPMTDGFVEQGVGQGMVGLAPEYGLEIVANVPYPPGNQEWSSVATQLRDADADIVINNGLAVDPIGIIEAMAQLNYEPPLFFTLFPAPGPVLGLGELGEGVLSVSLFLPARKAAPRGASTSTAMVADTDPRGPGRGGPGSLISYVSSCAAKP